MTILKRKRTTPLSDNKALSHVQTAPSWDRSCSCPRNPAARLSLAPGLGAVVHDLSMDSVHSPSLLLPWQTSPRRHLKPRTAPRALSNGCYMHKSDFFLTHLYYVTISISNYWCCSHHKSCSCFYLPIRPRWSCVQACPYI